MKENKKESKIASVRQLLFDNLQSIDELAADLNYSRSTIYQWVHQGMPTRKVRGRLYFSPEEVALWMQRTTR